MVKRIFLIFVCFAFIALSGCGEKVDRLTVEDGDQPDLSLQKSQSSQISVVINPLTGLDDINEEKADSRPVAVMINNIKEAQGVQTGVGEADIVYETEVEGGITRLMAVYQNISSVGKIGSIRSARYAFVDLAMGHNAIYIHHGEDPTYCKPHLKDTDHFSLSEDNYGTRIPNGLPKEHTLYTQGDRVWKGLVSDGWKIKNTKSESWQSFADKDSPVAFETAAASVTVPFSTSYKTTFKYDATSGKYTRLSNGKELTDYNSGAKIQFKNIFVLMTSITNYSDGKHRNIKLTGGTGYYCVNGTYTRINWSKGNASSPFVFTTADGQKLIVNPGNSWVCIADSHTSNPVFE